MYGKKALCLFLTLLFAVSVTLSVPVSADNTVYVTSSSPGIPVTVGETVLLSDLVFFFSNTASYGGAECELSCGDGAVVISDGRLSCSAAGVYAAEASHGTDKMTVYIICRASASDGYVLFEDDFSSPLSSDYKVLPGGEGRVSVSDGYLMIDGRGSDSVRVLLPEYLSSFGDYTITLTATLLEPANAARWNSVMYRVQNSDYPYYQMCVRSGATASNGVEFAKRTPQNTWNVTATGSNSEDISPDKLYTYTVRARGTEASHSIDGEELVAYDKLSYRTGAIGLQANQSVMKADKIMVEYVPGENEGHSEKKPEYVLTSQPDTGIIGSICFSEFITTAAELDAVTAAEIKPANVIFYVNSSLKVTSADGVAEFSSLEDAIKALDEKIMPTLYIRDEAVLEGLEAYLKASDLEDVFIMSDRPELVLAMRKAVKITRGVVDFSASYTDAEAVTDEELLRIRDITCTNFATVAAIPSNIATLRSVTYLRDRLLSVWVVGQSPLEGVADGYRLLTTGAHGIVSDNTPLLCEVAQSIMSGNKLLRAPLNVGHRGIPSRAPENTLEGSLLAYELGADAIENDVYLTADGEIVVMHNATSGATCDRDLNIEGSTLAQLKELYANKQYPNDRKYKECRIPTLREYYEAFAGKDVQIFVEIKSQKAEIITKFKELTEEYNMRGQVSVITFHAAQVTRLKREYPEMSVGYLCGCSANGENGAEKAGAVLSVVQKLGSTYNPSYGGHTEDYIVNANIRGITTWPWTIDDNPTYIAAFMQGYNGLTTNRCNIAGDFVKYLTCPEYTYTVDIGSRLTASVEKTLYSRQSADASAEARLIILQGGDNVTVNGTELTFGQKAGSVVYGWEYTYKINSANSYTVYSEPVTVNVIDPSAVTEAPQTQTPDTAAEKPGAVPGKVSAWIWASGAVLVAALAAVAVVVWRKKKK